jgi:nicotinamidase-related amidase
MPGLDLTRRRMVHLCVDMQKMFAEETEWRTPWMDRVLPVVTEIAERHAADTIFTRFMPPANPDEAAGVGWKAYFERWRSFTTERMDPALIELVEPLRRLIPPAETLDKPAFSPFSGTDLRQRLQQRKADTLVITGAETDVCVLAAVLSAVDHGYFVILPKDALCSSSDETHDALLKLYAGRFSQQVVFTDAESLLRAWPERSAAA